MVCELHPQVPHSVLTLICEGRGIIPSEAVATDSGD